MDAVTAENQAAPKAAAEIDLGIEGMTCASCVRRAEKALGRVPGVVVVSVNLGTERARVAFDGPPDAATLAATVREAGYMIPETTIDLAIGGMTCGRRPATAVCSAPTAPRHVRPCRWRTQQTATGGDGRSRRSRNAIYGVVKGWRLPRAATVPRRAQAIVPVAG
jgi:copper chaperone CopZ